MSLVVFRVSVALLLLLLWSVAVSGFVDEIDLGGDMWSLDNHGTGCHANVSLPSSSGVVVVPGVVHTDLLAAGVLGDEALYYRYRYVDELPWIYRDCWTYRRSVVIDAAMLANDEIQLICEGLDTIATVVVNEQVVGHANNQFRRWVFSVKDFLVEGANTLEIRFSSASEYARLQAASHNYTLPESTSQPDSHGELHRNMIRKASCHFAWDWGPAFLTQGIWLPIRIVGFRNTLVISYVRPLVRNPNEDGDFPLEISAELQATTNMTASLAVAVEGVLSFPKQPFSVTTGMNTVAFGFVVPQSLVDLWWPVGYGEQPLYYVRVDIEVNDAVVATSRKRIGFRKVELVQELYDDRIGESFFFRINDVPIWSKGANLIPMDSFESQVTDEVIDRLVQSSLDANMNTIRIWGGGLYQHEYLYDICDERGLMVWEEFMFACALYPTDASFLENVRQEVHHQVSRLIHHASIVIWSGNNENEQSITQDWYTEPQLNPFLYAIDYDKLYHATVRDELIKLDNARPFLSSSPANGVITYDPFQERWISPTGGNSNDERYGDNHYYNYKDDCEDVTKMLSPRFSSEYGFQSMPSFYTLKEVTEEGDWYWDSDLIKFRNHRTGDGQEEIRAQMELHFLFPAKEDNVEEFRRFIYLSQATQALCYRAQTEHYRRSKSLQANTMGALYWQLNDIWQASTWSSLEYGGRWKMLHYFAKRFFAPVLVSSFKPANGDTMEVYLVSDLTSPLSGELAIDVYQWNGLVRRTSLAMNATVSALGSVSVGEFSTSQLCEGEVNDCVMHLVFRSNDGEVQTDGHFYPAKLKDVGSYLQEPTMNVSDVRFVDETTLSLTISTTEIAPYVFLETPIAGRFSDNGFLLLPSESGSLTFFGWEAFTVDEWLNSLEIVSLYDALPEPMIADSESEQNMQNKK